MVFNATQLDFFFTLADYLGLSAWTAGAFAAKGIPTPEDLGKFDKDGLDMIYCNLRKPPCALQGSADKVVCAVAAAFRT